MAKRTRTVLEKENEDQRANRRRMVKLHLFARETLASSSSESDAEDGLNSAEGLREYGSGAGGVGASLQVPESKRLRTNPVSAQFNLEPPSPGVVACRPLPGHSTPPPLPGHAQSGGSALRVGACPGEGPTLGPPVASRSSTRDSTPDLTCVPDTPEGDLSGGLQHRKHGKGENLLRAALRAAATKADKVRDGGLKAHSSYHQENALWGGREHVPHSTGAGMAFRPANTAHRTAHDIRLDSPGANLDTASPLLKGTSHRQSVERQWSGRRGGSVVTTPEAVPDSPPESDSVDHKQGHAQCGDPPDAADRQRLNLTAAGPATLSQRRACSSRAHSALGDAKADAAAGVSQQPGHVGVAWITHQPSSLGAHEMNDRSNLSMSEVPRLALASAAANHIPSGDAARRPFKKPRIAAASQGPGIAGVGLENGHIVLSDKRGQQGLMLDLGSACEDLPEHGQLGPQLDSQRMDSPGWQPSNPEGAGSAEDLEFVAPTPAPCDAEERNGFDAGVGEPGNAPSTAAGCQTAFCGNRPSLLSPMDDEVLAAIAAAELSHERKARKASPTPNPQQPHGLPELPAGNSPMPVWHMDFGLASRLSIPVNPGAVESPRADGDGQNPLEGLSSSSHIICMAAPSANAPVKQTSTALGETGIPGRRNQPAVPPDVSDSGAEPARDGGVDEGAHHKSKMQPVGNSNEGECAREVANGATHLRSALSILGGRRARPEPRGDWSGTAAPHAKQTEAGKHLPRNDPGITNVDFNASPMVIDSVGTLPLPDCPTAATAVNCSQDVPTPETETNEAGGISVKLEHRKLEAYLPPKVVGILREAGISRDLYEWQAEALLQPDVLKGRNLVYAAPTGAGKSAVAEILMMRRILTTNRPALLVFPFVALCRERAAEIKKLLAPLNKDVCTMWGREQGSINEQTGAIVCTFERANAFINRKLEDEELNMLSCIVVDELHMVMDEGRGYLLELLLTKLRYATAPLDADEEPDSWNEAVQIVGMSATMPNASAAANWLGARLYETMFRPVPLVKYLKVGSRLLDDTGKVVRELDLGPHVKDQEDAHLGVLAQETVSDGHAVLVFCATRKACEIAAKHLASFLGTLSERHLLPNAEASQSYRDKICGDLQKVAEHNAVLLDCIRHGVAFHHAGLGGEERKLVEIAYRSGAVSVLTATSTVAAGVNLPARRVIFREAYKVNNRTPLSAADFLQMSGRAGRPGLDTLGEAILMAPPHVTSQKGYQHLLKLLVAHPEPIMSCLADDRLGMKQAILEIVASKAVSSLDDVKRYTKCTLLAATHDIKSGVIDSTKAALNWLQMHDLLSWDPAKQLWSPTALGTAAFVSNLAPDEALTLKQDLARASAHMNLESDLHLTYLVTPTNTDLFPTWERIYNVINDLQGVDDRVATMVGVNRGFLQRKMRGRRVVGDEKEVEKERVAKRFYTALVLHSLIQEEPVSRVADRYGVSSDKVQELQDRAAGFAAKVAAFCERTGHSCLEMLIAKFQTRLACGVRPDLVALVDIPFVNAHRARLLFDKGLRSLKDVAAAPKDTIFAAFMSGPKGSGDQVKREGIMRIIARKVHRGAREMLEKERKELAQKVRDLKAALQVPTTAEAEATGQPAMSTPITTEPISTNPMPHAAAVEMETTAKRAIVKPAAVLEAVHKELEDQGDIPLSAHLPLSLEQIADAQGIVFLQGADSISRFKQSLSKQPWWAWDLDWEPAGSPALAQLQASLALPNFPGHGDEGDESILGSSTAGAKVYGIAISYRDGASFYLEATGESWGVISSIMEMPQPLKVTFNLKPQMAVLAVAPPNTWRKPVCVTDPLLDVRIAAWTLTPNARHVMDHPRKGDLMRNLEQILEGHAVGAALHVKSMMNCQSFRPPQRLEHACRRAAMSRILWERLEPILKVQGLHEPLHTVEMPLVRVLADMETTGVLIDPDMLSKQKVPLQRQLKILEQDIMGCVENKELRKTKNLQTPADVSWLLFEHLKLDPPPGVTALRHGGYSTNAKVLAELEPQHVVPALIMQYRTLQKWLTGCLADLEHRAQYSSDVVRDPAAPERRFVRIRGTFHQTSTQTGRLAMDCPNLQNIPNNKAFTVPATQTPPDGELRGQRFHEASVRSAFVPPPGFVLLSADYCQVELRIMAHLSGDAGLCGLLRQSGHDPFTAIAASWLSKEQVTPKERDHAKSIAYGLLYGMGPRALENSLRQLLGCSADAAIRHRDAFMAAWPGVIAWRQRVIEDCRKHGYVQTLRGRRRPLPDIYGRPGGPGGRNSAVRAHGERQALNTVCQASAADLIKVAMIDIHRQSTAVFPGALHMILQIHDELVFEVRTDVLPEAALLVKQAMEQAVDLQVPLPVKLKIGSSWGHLQEYRPPQC